MEEHTKKAPYAGPDLKSMHIPNAHVLSERIYGHGLVWAD